MEELLKLLCWIHNAVHLRGGGVWLFSLVRRKRIR